MKLQYVWLPFALIILYCGIFLLRTPLPILLDRYIPDDAFYYFNTARHFAQRGFSSFDGLHFTNGYHPLWFLCCVPLFRLFPHGGEWPIRLLLAVQLCFALLTSLLVISAFARHFGPLATTVSGGIWVVIYQRFMLNGLETPLLVLSYLALFTSYAHWCTAPYSARSSRQLLQLGLLAGVVFLARTDSIFLSHCSVPSC